MRILVTGGLGFIGSHVVRWLFSHVPQVEIVNLDVMTYAGNPANLEDIPPDAAYRWERVSLLDGVGLERVFADGRFDVVMHLAAESHVDRSIESSLPFFETNVVGTARLLEMARRYHVGRFLHVSTDEVYGSLGLTGYFTEETPLDPRSPYSASKASSDLIVLAAYHTYGQDVVVTRCSNNYGPYQFPEKLIPLLITNGLQQKPWPLYGDGQHIRDWLYVEDHVEALWAAVLKGEPGRVYNIGGRNERANREVVDTLLEIMGLPSSTVVPVADRLGHDRRYAIDPSRAARELGWSPHHGWHQSLEHTVAWYKHHRAWWEAIKEGSYQDDYHMRHGTMAPREPHS